MSKPDQLSSMAYEGTTFVLAVSSKCISFDHINCEVKLYPFFFGFQQKLFGKLYIIVFTDGTTDFSALGLHESIGHSAADDQVINRIQEVFDDGNFGRNF